MTRSLVIAPQWIGDAVMTEPLLRRLQARGERLTIGALPWVAPVYRAMPQVAAVIDLPFAHGGLQLRERLRMAKRFKDQFDVAYVCPNSLKSALLPLLAGIPKRVGYLGEARVGLLTHRLSNPPKAQRPPMVAFYSALSGEPGTAIDRPRLLLSPETVRNTLAQFGLTAGGYVVMAPGAEYGPAKRWPTSHFAAVAQQLDLPAVLLGSSKEAELCNEIEQGCASHNTLGSPTPHIINLAGKTSLAQALSLIAATKSIVSNDSGLMHVAAGFGVRQVAIFGSSSPLHTPPLNPLAKVLWLKSDAIYQPPLDCAPCFERVCPLGHTRCLQDVSAVEVLRFL
ncbi:MAG: lipopolysaccharide heptosyltransferase II [Comamonadaceae bacterium]|nr:lipopolysaccharide heptosyltransferase II [Comamonadaceae bacterium]